MQHFSEMFEPVLKACGIKRSPIITIPAVSLNMSLRFVLKWFFRHHDMNLEMQGGEKLSHLLKRVGIKYTPPLTVHEAHKATTHHTASIEAAAADFG